LTDPPVELKLIQLGDVVNEPPPLSWSEAGGIGEIENGVALRAKLDSLVFRRQKSAAPLPIGERLVVWIAGTLRDHHHECRQIFVLAPQSIRQPGTDRWPTGELKACLEKSDRGIMIDRFCVQGLDEADVVGDFGEMRQQFADPGA